MRKRTFKTFTSCVLCSLICGIPVVASATELDLQAVIKMAHELDPQLKQSEFRQIALEHESVEQSYWQDPRVSLTVANVPVESFSLDQEPMTQVVLGVSQMLPRGSRLKLQREQLLERSKIEEAVRQQRIAQTKRDITLLWLDALREQEKIQIIEKNRKFFEQLSELSSASYISTRGKTRQLHLIRTELEIMKLDEKLQRFLQNRDRYVQSLNVWLLSDTTDSGLDIGVLENPQLQLDDVMVKLSSSAIQTIITQHPEVQAIAQKMRSAKKTIALSRELGEPMWGVNAKYGYREGEREDFFSLGVSVDVPINRRKKNRRSVSAATQLHASIKQQRLGTLRKLQSNFQQYRSQIQHLENRQRYYQENILTQVRVETESVQNAYISDEGDFRDVIRALMGELSAELEVLEIDIQRQKNIAKLEYLTTGTAS